MSKLQRFANKHFLILSFSQIILCYILAILMQNNHIILTILAIMYVIWSAIFSILAVIALDI